MRAMVLHKIGAAAGAFGTARPAAGSRPDSRPGRGLCRLSHRSPCGRRVTCPVRSCRSFRDMKSWVASRRSVRVFPGTGLAGVSGYPGVATPADTAVIARMGREKPLRRAAVHGLYPRRGLRYPCGRGSGVCIRTCRGRDPVSLAPLLCAGPDRLAILEEGREGRRIGLYGFGAAAHIIAQICRW
jgi:hypothetical protein